jgi:cytochrome c oxidase assembly protein subunit 15
MFVVVVMGVLVTQSGSAEGCGAEWPLCDGRLVPLFTLHALIEFSHRVVAGVAALATVSLFGWVWASTRRVDLRVLSLGGLGFVLVQAFLGAAAVLWPESAPVLALHFGFSVLALLGVGLTAVVLTQLAHPPTAGPWRRTPAPPTLTRLAWVTLAYLYALAYLGAYVAHADAGLACTGWPLCDGRLLPPPAPEAWVAFAHRLAALVGGLLVLALFLAARRTPARRDLVGGSAVALGLAAAQVGSGALLVLSRLAVGATLLHAALAALLFAAVAYVCLETLPDTPEPAPSWRAAAEVR